MSAPPLPAELRRQLVEALARLLLADLERRPVRPREGDEHVAARTPAP